MEDEADPMVWVERLWFSTHRAQRRPGTKLLAFETEEELRAAWDLLTKPPAGEA